MGRLRDKFPPRLVDPLYGVKSHVARRNGMVDPAKERRRQRATERAPIVGGEAPGAAAVTVWASDTWNPGSVSAGDDTGVDIAAAGVESDGSWVCTASFSNLEDLGNDQWIISAWPKSGGTCRVIINNQSGNPHDLTSGTVLCKCEKRP